MREDYAVWLTQDINDGLFPFEQALRTIGAGEHFVSSTINVERYADQRARKIEQIYEDFKSIIMIGGEDSSNPEIAVESVREKVRDILGVKELAQLRKNLINDATK